MTSTTSAAWRRISEDLRAAEAEQNFSDALRLFGNFLRLASVVEPSGESPDRQAGRKALIQNASALYLAALRLRCAVKDKANASILDEFRLVSAGLNIASDLMIDDEDVFGPQLLGAARELIRRAHEAYGSHKSSG